MFFYTLDNQCMPSIWISLKNHTLLPVMHARVKNWLLLMVKSVNWLLKILLLQLLTNLFLLVVSWVVHQLKLITTLKMLSSKLLFLMENLFVRQVAVLTFVQNRHHALKKVLITILSLKLLILQQQCCKNWQMDLFLQAVFKQVQSTQNQSKFLQVLTMWMSV